MKLFLIEKNDRFPHILRTSIQWWTIFNSPIDFIFEHRFPSRFILDCETGWNCDWQEKFEYGTISWIIIRFYYEIIFSNFNVSTSSHPQLYSKYFEYEWKEYIFRYHMFIIYVLKHISVIGISWCCKSEILFEWLIDLCFHFLYETLTVNLLGQSWTDGWFHWEF